MKPNVTKHICNSAADCGAFTGQFGKQAVEERE